jgi:putative membrane protein
MGQAPPPDLGLQRTILAAERTLLSWVRTALSMVGFGFTIYKFFDYMRESEKLVRPHAPRNFGLTLIALGALTLFFAVVQHRRFLQRLGLGVRDSHTVGPVVVATVLGVMALVVFVSVYFRTGPF